jgi:hypothetical protein
MRLLHYIWGHAVSEEPRGIFETRSQAYFERLRRCSNKACLLQQDINRKKRIEYLYKRDNEKRPEALICYDCSIFHPRLRHLKHCLYTYPVKCDHSPRVKTVQQFIMEKKRGNVAAIVIMAKPVPWLQVHQNMRALRYGLEYGNLTLNRWGGAHQSSNEVYDSEVRLIEGRLLVRERQIHTLGYFAAQEPSRSEDEFQLRLQLSCPHACELFNSRTDLQLEKLEAYKRACVENETAGFVQRRLICKRCRTETVIEVIRREDFECDKQMAPSSYVICQSRYIDLGRCESPHDPDWKILSTWWKRRPDKLSASSKRAKQISDDMGATNEGYEDPISRRFDRRLGSQTLQQGLVGADKITEEEPTAPYSDSEGILEDIT